MNDNTLVLQITGRLDTAGVPKFDAMFADAFEKSNNIVLDFSNAEYVTSVGLRSLLVAQKKVNKSGGVMKLINVPDSLTEIFEMTGFVNFLRIE